MQVAVLQQSSGLSVAKETWCDGLQQGDPHTLCSSY